MKTNQLLLFLGLAAAGLPAGYAAKRMDAGQPPGPAAMDAAAAPGLPAKGEDPRAASAATAAVLKSVARSRIRSADTLESIKDVPAGELYGRLALWMVDASERDIAAYWQHYRQEKNRANEITDLIFINWTRIDPRAATAAAKGTGDEHYAWWAWACHDPKGALAAAMAENPDRVNNVTWGIGEFHKEWLREHFDELPESSRDNALQGMAKWDDGEDPLATLEFLKAKGHGFHAGIFNVLVRKDPWAAYDWLEANGSKQASRYGGSTDVMGSFVKTVGEQYPDVLKRIAELSPSGETKRKLEAVLFENLLKTDPEAAIEQARTTEAPRIATQRLAAAGLSLVQTDPERAFELAGKLFAVDPEAVNGSTWIEYEGGKSGSGNQNPEVDQLMDALLAKDPARVMEMSLPGMNQSTDSAFSQLSSQWAQRDLFAYSEWVKGQQDPKVRDRAAGPVINQLQQEQQFEDAAGWAMSLDLSRSRANYLRNVLSNWKQASPDDALRWLDSAELPEAEIKELKTSLGVQP